MYSLALTMVMWVGTIAEQHAYAHCLYYPLGADMMLM